MGKLILLLLAGLGGFYAFEHYFGDKTPPARLAPEGTVYNLVRTNAAGDATLVGIPPGTELQLIEKSSGATTVEYQGIRFTMPDTTLTRDLDAVDQIRQGEARRLAKTQQRDPVDQSPPRAPAPDPELEKLERSLLSLADKRADLEHRLAQIEVSRREKGNFDGLTDLRVAASEISTRIQRIDLDTERLRQLIERKKR